MKRILPLLTLAVLGILLASCSTFESRAKARAATYDSLSPAQRAKLKEGVIELGDTPDMVYIALGEPDEKTEKNSAAKHEQIWIYNSYHRDFEGTAQTGFRRVVFFDPRAKRYLIYNEPVFSDLYSINTEERIRITFENGKVTSLEQPKAPTSK